jgi:hypothetical protein
MSRFNPGDFVHASAEGVEKGKLKDNVKYEVIKFGIDDKYIKVIESGKRTDIYYPESFFVVAL